MLYQIDQSNIRLLGKCGKRQFMELIIADTYAEIVLYCIYTFI